MKKIVKCIVADEHIVGDEVVLGAAGSHDDVVLELAFSPLWDGTTKQAVWLDAYGETPTVGLLTADMLSEGTNTYQITVPGEAKRVEGMCHLTIRGAVSEDDLELSATMTATARFRILPARWDNDAAESQDVTPTQAVQLQQQIDKVLGDIVIAKESADRAWNSALAAAESEQRAAESEDNAFSSYESSVEYSVIAKDAAATAVQQANLAGNYAENALEATKKPPVIGANGNWEVWNANANQYIDTGVSATGPAGEDGYTPQKGVDYWTESDKQEIVDYVVDNVPAGSFLPAVSTEENGMVLRVVNGEWVPSEGGDEDTEERLTELESQMADLLYKAISITSFTHNAGTKEMGDTVTAVTLSWSINKTPTVLTLDGEELAENAVNLALSDLSITKDNNKTWTLKATDERGATSTKTTTISFQNGIYHGGAALPETIDSAFIMALASKTLTGTKNRTVTIAGGDGLYAWYAYPKRLGTSLFNIGGFDYEYELTTVAFENQFGFTEDYYVYRSGQYAPESLSVTVKNGG